MAALLSLTALALLGGSASAQTFQGTAQGGFPDCVNGPLSNNTVCDKSADPIARARALVSAFTVAEKLNLTGNNSPGVPRLGLPIYQWWNEALHGVAESPGVTFNATGEFRYATSFPQPITMGAAFDDELITAVAEIVSTEARAFNNHGRAGLDFWTPNINPYRDPRWGRGQETPGEDSFHLSSYVHALILGLQGGEDPEIRKVTATCKHFAGYDIESWNGNLRYQNDVQISQRDLVEYYLPSFRSCARDSNVGAFMCTYSALNGVPTCADPWLLNDVLREHWGWTNEEQWVTSDCDSIQNIYLPHNFSDTRQGAAAAALNAGTDLDCGTYYQHHLPQAYSEGLINQTTVDQSLLRLYTSLVRTGYFDGPDAMYRNLTFSDVSTPHAQQIALTAAEEGIVLLKNDGLLPLTVTNSTKIAVIGDWANATQQMIGNYFGVPPYLHSPLYAAQQSGAQVFYAGGPGGQGDPTTDHWLPMWTAAEKADIIIYAGGLDISVEAEGMDRETINWTGAQLDAIGELASYGKPTIVAQMGDQLDNTPLLQNSNISALLWGGYPGQDGGVALFNIITGKTAPAGRLPVTQYPAHYVADIPMTDMTLRPNETTGSPGRTYKWYNGTAVFEFGYGMHYTNFTADVNPMAASSYDISALTSNCNETYKDKCAFESVSVNVHNTGSVSSDYVTLGFLAGQFGPSPYPKKSLVSYQRLHSIAGGASATATLDLTLGSLARVDDVGNTVLYPGDYALMIDTMPEKTMVNFTLTGSPVTLDLWPQPPSGGPTIPPSDYFYGGYGSRGEFPIAATTEDLEPEK
ncbi:1,4-beta-D-xylosidase [Aureobasidium pullulans]|nr:1,4-beta-D-xylosidase [Aureobasidium pullulans]